MCGVAGFIAYEPCDLQAQAQAMSAALEHRGPDGHGIWIDQDAGVALAHRRLSIIDLSDAGHQPMVSFSGRWVLTYNGEIYNHLELRRLLEAQAKAPNWRGHSDTETILAAIDAWGLEETLRKCVGMFALGLWDRVDCTLSLARDRMGEKPLYYGWQNNTLIFGSELKALTAHPACRKNVDRDALALLLRHNYIPAPYSIWQGIRKLPPGTILTIPRSQQEAEPVPYWQLSELVEAGERRASAVHWHDAANELERTLSEAIGGQMLSDVALGALLSGGVDSSIVVALMQRQSSKPVRTFSIGFEEKAFDESSYAAAVARHLGTDHSELRLGAADVLEMVPRMSSTYDEPFADSSQLPTALVMTLAKKQVTVALSGDGGDELFGGYNRYISAPKVWKILRLMPYSVRQHVSKLLTGISVAQWDALTRPLAGVLRQAHIGNKLHRVGQRLLGIRSVDDLYVALQVEWPNADSIVMGSRTPDTLLSSRNLWPMLENPVNRMMAVDALCYLPDDILVKVDRAAMAVSLETRAPFLDHRVVEFSARLPISMKIANGQGKVLLGKFFIGMCPDI